jgi:hypothetical protein
MLVILFFISALAFVRSCLSQPFEIDELRVKANLGYVRG